MLCTAPRSAWQPSSGGPLLFSPRRISDAGISFEHRFGVGPVGYKAFKLPCGQCLSCRIDIARQAAVRCVHEAQMHEHSTFITLTYDSDHLPPPGRKGPSLVKEDFQLFAGRLRERMGSMVIFYCGEYGELRSRPHFHAAVFGFRFPDQEQVENSCSGLPQYDSKLLSRIWGKGRTRIGELNFDSAAYIARYTVKKVIGKGAGDHYGDRVPEYCVYPKRPALGRTWFERFYRDVFPGDEVVVSRDGIGYPQRPPRYYVKLLERVDPSMAAYVRDNRARRAREMMEADIDRGSIDPEMCWLRQAQRRDALIEKFKLLRRDLEL